MKNVKKARHLEAVITVEELTSKNRTIEDVTAILDAHKSVDVYVIALHDKDVKDDGSPVKAHYHIYVHFRNTSYSVDMLAKMLDVAPNKVSYITADRAGGNAQRARYYTLLYYTHAGTEKQAYDSAGFICSPGFDAKDFLEKESKKQKSSSGSELQEILLKCCSGEITPNNYTERIPGAMYAQNRAKIEAAFAFCNDTRECIFPEGFLRKNIYICGASGTGKTTLAKLFAKQNEQKMHVATRGKFPLDGYHSEEVLLLDDIRANEPFSAVELLDICAESEYHFFRARYHNRLLMHDVSIMTSVYTPEQLWESFYLNSVDEKAQFLRRIHELWMVTDESISMYKYVLENGLYVRQFVSEMPNPVKAFLIQQKIEHNPAESLATLTQINEKYLDESGIKADENLTVENPFFELDDGVETPWDEAETKGGQK